MKRIPWQPTAIGSAPAADAIPLALEAGGPVAQQVHLFEEDDGPAMGGHGGVGAAPRAFPEPGQGGLGAVGRGIVHDGPQPAGKLEQERGLADLPRAGEQLQPSRGRFLRSFQQDLQACAVAEAELAIGHGLIIIRLLPN